MSILAREMKARTVVGRGGGRRACLVTAGLSYVSGEGERNSAMMIDAMSNDKKIQAECPRFVFASFFAFHVGCSASRLLPFRYLVGERFGGGGANRCFPPPPLGLCGVP